MMCCNAGRTHCCSVPRNTDRPSGLSAQAALLSPTRLLKSRATLAAVLNKTKESPPIIYLAYIKTMQKKKKRHCDSKMKVGSGLRDSVFPHTNVI